MYDLTVDGAHTFTVGDAQWVVHNCGNRSVFDGLVNNQRISTGEVLELGQQFVGPNARQVDDGVWVSELSVDGADVHAMFRITDGDIRGTHGGGPHANFQLVSKVVDPITGRVSYQSIPNQNLHIYFNDAP